MNTCLKNMNFQKPSARARVFPDRGVPPVIIQLLMVLVGFSNHPAIGVLPFMETPSCASLKEEGLVIFTRAGIGEEGNLSPSSTIFHGEQGLQMVHAKNVPANFSSWVPCIKSM